MRFRPTPQQERAISCLDGPLCITAGAGSGKTRVLAERLAEAMDPGRAEPIELGRTLVVTFTEKAAGELAERVRRVLLERGRVDEARRVDRAWISTIHGLCRRLLRAHAVEAGVDPCFTVISAARAVALREEVFERIAGRALETGSAADLIGEYGVSRVQDMVFGVHDRLRAMGMTPVDVSVEEPADPVRTLEAARGAVADWLERLSAHPGPSRTLQAVAASVAAAGEELDLAGSLEALPRGHLARHVLTILQNVKLSGNLGVARELVEGIAMERAQLLDRAIRAVAVPFASSLLELVSAFGSAYDDAKRRAGVLDFEDLQLGAVRLLADPDGPGDRYRERFRLVMVDEFQDTNDVQAALTDLLSEGDLCTVGDERQSIYSFRFADVAVYQRHTASMLASGAERVELATNFRSHRDVLSFVNGLVAHPLFFGPSFLALEHGRDESGPPRLAWPDACRVQLAVVDARGCAADVARATEADAVGRRLREYVDHGSRQGDIVVLLRAMTHADRYAEALRTHGLEPLLMSGGAFFEQPEIEACTAFLRAVSNPLDDASLAHVLASRLARMSDDGLIALRRTAGTGPLWDALTCAPLRAADARIAERVGETIRRARSRLGRESVSDVLLLAVEELDLDLRLLADGDGGRRAYANVLKLARMAHEHESAGGSGVRSFVEHLTLVRRSGDRVSPATLVDGHADAVRIMTVHAAKGLEFPIVAVPELGRCTPGRSDIFILEKSERAATLALALPDDGEKRPADQRRSARMSAALERAGALERDEELRLLYVAITRAREALLLSGSTDLGGRGRERPIDRIREAIGLAHDTGECRPVDVGGAAVHVSVLSAAEPIAVQSAPRPPAGHARREGPPVAPPAVRHGRGSIATPPTVSYSAMRVYATCPLRYHAAHVARLGSIDFGPRGEPRRFGDAVHAALRTAGPGGQPLSAERLAAIARRWRLSPDEAARLRAAADSFAGSGVCRAAYAQGIPAREVPFAIALPGCTLTGRLDLVFVAGDTTVVVDYKTGTDALADAAKEEHRAQADCYALALLMQGAGSVEVTFVGIETRERDDLRRLTFAYGAADADRLRRSIGERAAAVVGGPYEPLPAYLPAACDDCPAAHSVCPVRVPIRARR